MTEPGWALVRGDVLRVSTSPVPPASAMRAQSSGGVSECSSHSGGSGINPPLFIGAPQLPGVAAPGYEEPFWDGNTAARTIWVLFDPCSSTAFHSGATTNNPNLPKRREDHWARIPEVSAS